MVLAIGHILAGIVFFFAFNWFEMSGATKLTAIGIALGGSLLLFMLSPRASIAGQAGGIAATVLTGVLFAVIGQIYQTGADAWQLFVTWALLALPLALIARNALHMLVWQVIANIAWMTFAMQYLVAQGQLNEMGVPVIAGLAMLVIAGCRNLLLYRFGQGWLDYAWTRTLPVLTGLIYLGWTAIAAIIDFGEQETWPLIGAICFLIACTGLALHYRHHRDGFAVACLAGAGLAIFTGTLWGRILFENFTGRFENAVGHFTLLFLGGLALVWLYGQWVRRNWRKLDEDETPGTPLPPAEAQPA